MLTQARSNYVIQILKAYDINRILAAAEPSENEIISHIDSGAKRDE